MIRQSQRRIVDAVGREKLRLLVAEDNEYLREELLQVLDDEEEFSCVASTPSVDQIVPLCVSQEAQVVVLDLDLQGRSSLQELPSMRRALPDVRFVVFSGHENPEIIRGALRAGASAYVTKSTHTDRLIEAIKQVGT